MTRIITMNMDSSIQPTQRTVDSMRTPAIRQLTIRFTASGEQIWPSATLSVRIRRADGIPLVVIHDGQRQRHKDQEESGSPSRNIPTVISSKIGRPGTPYSPGPELTIAFATGSITPSVDSEKTAKIPANETTSKMIGGQLTRLTQDGEQVAHADGG